MKFLREIGYLIVGVCFSLAIAGCGDGSGAGSGASGVNSIAKLPDASSMLTSSKSTTSLVEAAVVGTPPPLVNITSSNSDQYFWNGIVADISAHGVSATDAQQFWGQHAGGAGGEGACRMAQNTAFAFEPILQSGSTFCYMKNMPSATSGVTLTPALSDPKTLFDQQAADRVVKINVHSTAAVKSASGHGPSGDMAVFLKVWGSNSVTSDVYKVNFWMCDPIKNTATDLQTLTVVRSTGSFTSVESNGSQGNNFAATISGSLTTDSKGNIIFDSSKNRLADVQNSFTGTGFSSLFHSSITITPSNLIYTKMYSQNSGTDPVSHQAVTWADKNYAIASFTGTGIADLTFLEAGFQGLNQNGSGTPFGYSGATQYQTSFYASVATSDLLTLALQVNLNTDSFWASSPTAPTLDSTGFSCAATPDFTVAMDFTDSAVATIAANCEQHQIADGGFCDSAAIQAARNSIQTYCQSGHQCF